MTKMPKPGLKNYINFNAVHSLWKSETAAIVFSLFGSDARKLHISEPVPGDMPLWNAGQQNKMNLNTRSSTTFSVELLLCAGWQCLQYDRNIKTAMSGVWSKVINKICFPGGGHRFPFSVILIHQFDQPTKDLGLPDG